jgi:hypothetical protein
MDKQLESPQNGAENSNPEGTFMSADEVVTNFPERAQVKRRPRYAVTSGRQLFVRGDPNSAWSRRYHDLLVSHISDVSAGRGSDALSAAQLSLIRRATSIECELERLDALLSQGEAVDLDGYGRASSHLRRLFETLGIERQQRDTTPTLGDILREGHAAIAREVDHAE